MASKSRSVGASEQAGTRLFVSELAEALLGRLSELTDRLVDEIYGNEPFYSEHIVAKDDVWRSCHDNVARHLETLSDAAHPAVEGATMRRDAAAATGKRRAEQGFPLDALLHAFRIGGRVIWEGFVDEARSRGLANSDWLLDGATLVWEVVDVHSMAVADAYRRTEFDIARRNEMYTQALFDALVSDGVNAARVASEAASALDLPEHGDYVVVVAELLPGTGANMDRASEELAMRSAWRVRHDREIGLVAVDGGGVEDITVVLSASARGRIGVSPVVGGLAFVAGGYAFAETALETIPRGTSGVALLDERLTGALVVRAPEVASRLRDLVLGPLDDVGDAERTVLVETLESYIGCGASAARTAARLFCHRNTVLNRIRRVETLTERTLSDPMDVVAFALALEAERLLTEPSA